MSPRNLLARILLFALGDHLSRSTPVLQLKNATGGPFCLTVFHKDWTSAKGYYNDPQEAVEDTKAIDETNLIAWQIVDIRTRRCWAYWSKGSQNKTDLKA
jgi:hypothetical protein